MFSKTSKYEAEVDDSVVSLILKMMENFALWATYNDVVFCICCVLVLYFYKKKMK
jgi:hypothetical protein